MSASADEQRAKSVVDCETSFSAALNDQVYAQFRARNALVSHSVQLDSFALNERLLSTLTLGRDRDGVEKCRYQTPWREKKRVSGKVSALIAKKAIYALRYRKQYTYFERFVVMSIHVAY